MKSEAQTISYQEALDCVMRAAETHGPLGTERVPLDESLGRTLAQDVTADRDMPPFNKSAMDGFACRRADLDAPLRVTDNIPAGRMPKGPVGPGECARIMTGAPVPDGADCVIMLEDTETLHDSTIKFVKDKTATNICPQGEDTKAGAVVLRKGEWVTPAHIAVLAAVGCEKPLVHQQFRVGVLATGDELVDPGATVSDARIRDSNSPQLCAQLRGIRAVPTFYGIARDTEKDIDAMLKRAMAEQDMVLASGGVSAGDFDLVPAILKANGFELLFESVAMQPGRPTVFGRHPGRAIFCCGLPGNPVSTFIIFEILLKPFILKLMGHDHHPLTIQATLAKPVSRRQTRRQATVPVAFTEPGQVAPVEFHGSGHINALCRAHALLTIPIGVSEIPAGSIVDVRLI